MNVMQNNKRTQRRLLSIKQLVDDVGATEWFWRTQIWNGNLPYIQVGKKMFVDHSDVEKFIQGHKHSNKQEF